MEFIRVYPDISGMYIGADCTDLKNKKGLIERYFIAVNGNRG